MTTSAFCTKGSLVHVQLCVIRALSLVSHAIICQDAAALALGYPYQQ